MIDGWRNWDGVQRALARSGSLTAATDFAATTSQNPNHGRWLIAATTTPPSSGRQRHATRNALTWDFVL
jgi:hypothetical protein